MPLLFLDVETYSECDLRAAGPYRYAEHSSTEVTLFAYAIDNEPVSVWDVTADPHMPEPLRTALNDPRTIRVAHNCGFERPVLRKCLAVDSTPERWHDTMAQAMTLALPAKLETLGTVVGLDESEAKVKDGKRLVIKFAKPHRNGKRHTRETDPDDWAAFIEYAAMDVNAMRSIYHRLPQWVYQGREYETWCLDQRINDRGVHIDLPLARGAIDTTKTEQTRIAARVNELTDGDVTSATQRDRLVRYLRDTLGVALDDAREQTLLEALRGDLPSQARELIGLRLQASKTSTAKYQAAADSTCADSRLRGGLQYYGANRTGRWSGRRLQPQNLPRPDISPDAIPTAAGSLIDGTTHLLYDDVMAVASSCIRSVLSASPGGKLVVSDLSNIEGRVLAWLAGEDWKLAAFHEFDVGAGPDLYCVTAASILGTTPDQIDKQTRTILGKVPELALGFAGSVGAFQNMARVYGTHMADHWPTLQRTLPSDVIDRADKAWPQRGKPSGLGYEEWVASEAVKIAWRDRHPNTVAFWHDLERAAISAVRQADVMFEAGAIRVKRHKQWLMVRLPSGRLLIYPFPRIVARYRPAPGGEATCDKCGGKGCDACAQFGAFSHGEQIEFRSGSNWMLEGTYNGALTNNVVQGTARDVLREGLHRAEMAGYSPVLTVHDEIICETPDDSAYTVDALSAMLSTRPEWADGLPLASAGYEADRYRKD